MTARDLEQDGWVQIGKDTRLRALVLDTEPPRWDGSWLRMRLWLKRATAIMLMAVVTAWLGWAVISGFEHQLAAYTKTAGTVTAQTDTSGRFAGCQLDVDYDVSGQHLHGLVNVNARCGSLPGPGAQVAIDVNSSDPHDIWIDGPSEATYPNPYLFLVFLLVGVPGLAFALLDWLTDYGRVRRLLSSGARWHRIEATVVRKDAGRYGVTVQLEAEDLTGAMRRFRVHYLYWSPIGPVRKGARVTITLITDGGRQAITSRAGSRRPLVAHFG